jgi:putative component of toxin-antitoxin plasmid stabilization module
MIEVIQTKVFKRWLARLRDRSIRSIISERLFRITQGIVSDVSPVGNGGKL